jgi:hypothetical protein
LRRIGFLLTLLAGWVSGPAAADLGYEPPRVLDPDTFEWVEVDWVERPPAPSGASAPDTRPDANVIDSIDPQARWRAGHDYSMREGRRAARAAGMVKTGMKALGGLEKLYGAASAAGSLSNSWESLKDFQGLTDEDKDALAAAELGNSAPVIPSKCALSDACTDCMQPAFDGLNELRLGWVKLDLLYRKTRKVRDDAIALGDAIASLPHAGLGWGPEKIKINRAFAEFETSYTSQHQKGIRRLEELLREIGACEREHLGGDGWYNTFGFLYVEFMRERYSIAHH